MEEEAVEVEDWTLRHMYTHICRQAHIAEDRAAYVVASFFLSTVSSLT